MSYSSIQLPTINPNDLGTARGQKLILDQLYRINDQLKYAFYNLDEENLTDGLAAKIQQIDAVKGVVDSALNAANGALSSIGKLGSLAYDDIVELAKLGETVIEGGYVKTNLLHISGLSSFASGYNPRTDQGVFLEQFDTLPSDWIRLGTGSVSLIANAGQSGGNALRLTGPCWHIYKNNITYDPTKLYRFIARVRQNSNPTSGNKYFYIGVEGYAADGVTKVNPEGNNTSFPQYYMCVGGQSLPADSKYVDYIGYFKGYGFTQTLVQAVSNQDFANGISGWTSTNVTGFAVSNKIATFTATAANGQISKAIDAGTVVGKIYYMRARVQTQGNAVRAVLGPGVSSPHSGSGQYEWLSVRFTATGTGHGIAIRDTAASGWQQISVKDIVCYCLTDIFGAGNEPTQALLDSMAPFATNSVKWNAWSPTSPGGLHPSVRYIRPLFGANWDEGNGVAEVDIISIDVVPEEYADASAQSKVDALAATLGPAATAAKIEKAMLGETVIVGGYFLTNLINANELYVNSANITGKLTANQLQIGDTTNLFQFNPDSNPGTFTVATYGGTKYFATATGQWSSITFLQAPNVDFLTGDKYYLSFKAVTDSAQSLTLAIRYYYTDDTWSNAAVTTLSVTTGVQTFTNTFTMAAPTAGKVVSYVRHFIEKPTAGGTIYVRDALIFKVAGTSTIADLAVTKAKIANLAVGTAQIEDIAVTKAKIANLAVGTAQIEDAAITNAKIASLTADKISGGDINGVTISGVVITGGTVRTSSGGTRLEMSGSSFKGYVSGTKRVEVATDAVYFFNAAGTQTGKLSGVSGDSTIPPASVGYPALKLSTRTETIVISAGLWGTFAPNEGAVFFPSFVCNSSSVQIRPALTGSGAAARIAFYNTGSTSATVDVQFNYLTA